MCQPGPNLINHHFARRTVNYKYIALALTVCRICVHRITRKSTQTWWTRLVNLVVLVQFTQTRKIFPLIQLYSRCSFVQWIAPSILYRRHFIISLMISLIFILFQQTTDQYEVIVHVADKCDGCKPEDRKVNHGNTYLIVRQKK